MTDQEKPRILFLNRSYWPDSEATGQLLTDLCEGLSEEFDVHVLAGQPNVSSISSEWDKVTKRNGVTIHRVRHTQYSKRTMALKAVNFVSFAMACRRHVLRLPKPDVVVFETDPFLLPFVASRLSKKTGCRVVGYLQDIYPDVAIALGKVSNSWPVRKLRESLFGIYRHCEQMVVLSSDMKNLLLASGVSENRITIVPNWADTESILPIDRENNQFLKRNRLEENFVVMYSGNLGLTQRLEEFVEAAAILRDDPEIKFVFVGQGARRAELEKLSTSLALSNVMFLDYQPLSELAHSLSAADLHLVPLTRELSQCLMPSKVYGILAAGRPYLTNAPQNSELRQMTETHQVGIPIEAGSPQVIANKIRESKADQSALKVMGMRCRILAESNYTKHHATKTFSQVLLSVLDLAGDTMAC